MSTGLNHSIECDLTDSLCVYYFDSLRKTVNLSETVYYIEQKSQYMYYNFYIFIMLPAFKMSLKYKLVILVFASPFINNKLC